MAVTSASRSGRLCVRSVPTTNSAATGARLQFVDQPQYVVIASQPLTTGSFDVERRSVVAERMVDEVHQSLHGSTC